MPAIAVQILVHRIQNAVSVRILVKKIGNAVAIDILVHNVSDTVSVQVFVQAVRDAIPVEVLVHLRDPHQPLPAPPVLGHALPTAALLHHLLRLSRLALHRVLHRVVGLLRVLLRRRALLVHVARALLRRRPEAHHLLLLLLRLLRGCLLGGRLLRVGHDAAHRALAVRPALRRLLLRAPLLLLMRLLCRLAAHPHLLLLALRLHAGHASAAAGHALAVRPTL
mmetsp:Transcript_9001/g.22904  ORF Transcript_9001/g.22904 Transcript_9001/m.22904 type:complete len:223 (-) Transcript_9001:99-767(-)